MSTIYVNNILPTTGDTSTVSGSFKVTGSMQVTGNVFMAGNLTVEGTTTTVNSTAVNITSSLTFEGPADAHETPLPSILPLSMSLVLSPLKDLLMIMKPLCMLVVTEQVQHLELIPLFTFLL